MSTLGQQAIGRLRFSVAENGLSTDELAMRAGLPAGHVQAMLDGIRPATLDELDALAQALDLSVVDLLQEPVDLPYDAPDGGADLSLNLPDGAPDLELALDPAGNQPMQLFQVGFGLGCDFFFHATAADLGESGIPSGVLQRYRDGILPIKLDAAFHRYNEPRYTPEGIHLKLSFDDVYDCFFAWTAIQRVIFSPVAPEPEPEPEARKVPFLRLVE